MSGERKRPIAVFDSGVGGVSVLAALRRLLPAEDYVYFGDNGNAPYGTRTPEQVEAFTLAAWDILSAYDPKLLLIACNTATSVAAPVLRARLSLPVVGMEPALKPAHQLRHDGAVWVLATPMTLALPKFESLMARYGEGAIPLACGGLMEYAERGEVDSPKLHAYLDALFAPLRGQAVDAVVLGCTHYFFLRRAIAAHLPPGVPVVDGHWGTALRAQSLLEQAGQMASGESGEVCWKTSGEAERVLPLMRRLYTLAERELGEGRTHGEAGF